MANNKPKLAYYLTSFFTLRGLGDLIFHPRVKWLSKINGFDFERLIGRDLKVSPFLRHNLGVKKVGNRFAG